MNTKKLLCALVLLLTVTSLSFAQKPYGGCWHPDDIRDWTPENDPDAKFNRSTVALQARFQDETLKANANQHYEGQLTACLTMNPMCSRCPAQGDNNFTGYNPTYWQYMDVLVWWAGSAGEGIIIPPSAPVTDAAHMSGVKSLGQLFFPPSTFGGQAAWVTQMLTKEGDEFPYARKMYEIAKYYGFDGWFVNEETLGGWNSTWEEWVNFYLDLAEADGQTNQEIQWYDCSTTIGSKINFLKRDGASFFANYGSPSISNIAAQMQTLKSAGCTDAQAFSSIYFGIECAQGGISGNASNIKNCFPADAHKGSIDLFCPEYPIWKQVVESILDSPQNCGETAYNKMNTVFNNEARFWVNPQHDPSNTAARSGGTNPGFANCLMERSTIQNLPFVTSFSAGLGKARYVNGENLGTHDWYHRGMQTIMPTWRWWIENNTSNDIAIAMDWDDAFNMGTSLKVSGKLTANTDYLTRLYKTKLAIANGTSLELVYKTNTAGSLEVKLATSEDSNAFTTFAVSETSQTNGWSVATIDLSSLAGKTVSAIALNFKSSSEVAAYEARLGQLAVYPASYNPTNVTVSNVQAQTPLTNGLCDVRLIWDADLNADFDHFNIYMTRHGEKKLIGQTRQLGFYAPKMQRTGQDEASITMSVVPVTKNMEEGTAVEKVLNFPALEKPEVTLKASKTLVQVNEELTVQALATNYPETYTWTLPEGGVLVSQDANTATIKFTKEGKFGVTVAVANATGSTSATVADYVDVSDSKTIEIVSVGSDIVSDTGHFGAEAPSNLVDGNEAGSMSQKWCFGGRKAHTVVLDLKKAFQIYRFKWFDCKSNEGGDNAKCYRIEVSGDNENWTEVLDVKNAGSLNVKDDYVKATVGRYVRFTPYDEENEITIRIWEFQVFGREGNLSVGAVDPIVMDINKTTHVTVPFSLGGDPKAANFAGTVALQPEGYATLENIQVNDADVQFDVKSGAMKGKCTAVVTVTNGQWTASSEIAVTLNDPNCKNLVLNNLPTVVTVSDVYDENNNPEGTAGAIGPKGITDGDVATWWSAAYKSGKTDNYITFDMGGEFDIAAIKFVFNKHGYMKWPVSGEVFASTTTDEDASYVKIVDLPSVTANEVEINVLDPEQAKQVKFVKVRLNSVNNYGFSLAELEVLGKEHGAVVAEPVLEAITITSGLNADVVAESKPSADATSAVLDDQGWVLFTSDVQAEGALCAADGVITTSTGTEFKLDPTTNNAAQIRQVNDAATLEFAAITQATEVHVLAICANGTASMDVVVNYEDGTSSDATTVQLGDWFQGSAAGTAVYGLDRIITSGRDGYATDQFDGRKNFSLFEGVVAVNPSKTVVSVTCTNKGNGQPTVMGIAIKHMSEGGSGINDLNNDNLTVYPNPVANGSVLNVAATAGATVQFVSLQGVVYNEVIATSDVTALPIQGMAQGTYLVVVKNNDEVRTTKVVVK